MARPTSGPDSKPPMTSKQAQKAYRERTRGPRLSKAEQRRIELAEQERIRRELDKEKSLNRARTLRERKKAKEKQALDEKKRKGLPLVKVRPSQDTIARFVRRGNGVGNKRDSEGEKVGLLAIEEETEDDRSVVGGGVDEMPDSPEAEADLPVIEEQAEADWLVTENGSDKHMPPKEVADTRDHKRRRLEFDPIEDKDDFGKSVGIQRTEMPAGAVEPGETVPILEAPQLKVTDIESAAKEVPATTVEFPWEKDRALKAQEPADGNLGTPRADAVSVIAVGTVQGQDDNFGDENMIHGKTGAEGKTSGDCTASPASNMRPKATAAHQKIPDTVSQSTKALSGSLPKEALARAHGIPPLHQKGTPSQGTTGHEKAGLTTPKPQPKGLVVSSMPKRTPVTKGMPTPQPPPARHHAALPPQPPRLAMEHTPVQHPSTRRVLQETTNSANRGRPASGTGSASKFISPFKPALATPQRQAPRTVPAFKQHRPETPTGRAPKSQFLPPLHLRNRAAHQRPSGPASAGKQVKRGPKEDIISASPPTSTQLFVMSHIDDVFPSPSQEAREIEGNLPVAANKQPMPAPVRLPIAGFATETASRPGQEPRRIPYGNAPLAPIAGFATRPVPRPRQSAPQVTPVNAPMAPPPRPTTVEPAAAKPAESFDFPFISSQDLLFSSQDLRELEETTPSKAKGTNDSKPPHCKQAPGAIQQRPSLLSHSSRPAVHHAIPRAGTKHPTLPAKARSASPHLPSPAQEVRKKQPCASKQGSAPRRQHTPDTNGSVFLANPGNLAGKETPTPGSPARPPSYEKPRFFGSSPGGVEMLLALHESRKTHEEEEERRRLAESESQQDSAGNNTKTMSQGRTAAGGEAEVATYMASQETDYGDVELDSMDFDELGLGSLLA